MISVHKMKHYPSRKEIPTQTTGWANLVSIMLNEKNTVKKGHVLCEPIHSKQPGW